MERTQCHRRFVGLFVHWRRQYLKTATTTRAHMNVRVCERASDAVRLTELFKRNFINLLRMPSPHHLRMCFISIYLLPRIRMYTEQVAITI